MSVSSEGGKPRPIRRVQLPDVAGLHLDDARIVLRSAGFEHVRVHYVEDYLADFHIVDQQPGSGILVDKHREIELKVSRSNLVQYLPTAFQQVAETPDSWLRGFLYIVQHMFDRVQGRVDDIHALFDPRTTDSEFLPWLASWMAISLNSEWSELQTRKMLMAATQLFPYRGTARSISEFVHIYTDAKVVVEENTWPFKGFRIGVHSTVGVDTVILPQMNLAHCFVVRLDRPAVKVPEDEIIRVHEIIQSQKPAHSAYFLAFSDEEETGEMGAFMEIGGGIGIGVGAGVGVGIGAGGEAVMIAAPSPEPEPEPEPEPKAKSKGRSRRAEAEVDAPADEAPADKKGRKASRQTTTSDDEGASAAPADDADTPAKPKSKSKSKSKSRSKKKKTSDE